MRKWFFFAGKGPLLAISVGLGLAGASIALAGPSHTSKIVKALLTGNISNYGAACGYDDPCSEVKLPATGTVTVGECNGGSCCSLEICDPPPAANECCPLTGTTCNQEYNAGIWACCSPVGGDCAQSSQIGSLSCCDDYAIASVSGTHGGGLANACLPPVGAANPKCGNCKEDDKVNPVGVAPAQLSPQSVPLSQCCSGFETNVNGTNPGPSYCCSAPGEGCNGPNVNGHGSWCCGSSVDPTLHGIAPFAKCEPNNVCCYMDGANCAQPSDCCSGTCSTGICGPPACQ